ncbi:MAG: hypothetical protein ACRDC4_00850 [Plesiomonas sp.]
MEAIIGVLILLFVYLLFGFFTAEIWKDLMADITNKKARILFRLVAVTFWPIWWAFWAVMVVIALIVMGIGYLFEIE